MFKQCGYCKRTFETYNRMQGYCCKSCKNCASSSRRTRRKNDEKGYPPPKYYTDIVPESSNKVESYVNVISQGNSYSKNGEFLSEDKLHKTEITKEQLETIISWGKTLKYLYRMNGNLLSVDLNDQQVFIELEEALKKYGRKPIDHTIFY